ncbi:hypothetical protein BDV25DRAFT_26305 [Aspergillus avenaceus]|uniref:C2H2-type domain-containing protein n=1 Tax=Aspergillus avenaceus TaxID=36643 RepID=A0A5N6TP12_ASPAV|nr:hypothetical protein BDV25DRAFT_26305 [Aspergillus avenaceus]
MVIKKCTICDRRFKKTEHFKRHERSHTKEKPYECNICHKRYSRSDVLSRHAKGHISSGANVNSGVVNRQSSVSSIQSPIHQHSSLPGHDNQQFPSMSGGMHAHPPQNSLTETNEISVPATGTFPPSSLDFLADISAHQARTGPDENPVQNVNQQTYLEVPSAHQASYKGITMDPMPNEMLQLWLHPHATSRALDPGRDAGFGLAAETIWDPFVQQHEHLDGTSPDDTGTQSGAGIPNERFAKVQRYWLGPSRNPGRLINDLWRKVASSNMENAFAFRSTQPFDGPPSLPQSSRYGLDEDCRRQLHAIFGYVRFQGHQQRFSEGWPPASDLAPIFLSNFPPAEILDMALDVYFRDIHPLMPFIHIPTFSAKTTNMFVLYTMCLIGMVLLGTQGTSTFVSRGFGTVLELLTSELAKCAAGTESPESMLSTFAAVSLFLHLAALTREKEHIEQSQMLYISLVSLAQRHGMFSANDGQLLDAGLFETISDIDVRWKAWGKVESVKRLIIGLLLMDSWCSSFLSTSPIIVPNSIQIILPCSHLLFGAETSTQWINLIHKGERTLMPTVVAPSEKVELPDLDSHVDNLGVYGVLSMVQLQLSEAYYRLLSNRANYPFAPCHTYAMDGRARCLSSLQVQIASKYGHCLERCDPNAAILWHSMCMALTADIQIFDLAAGRAGPSPARKALDEIAAWSRTPAARRACLHAAHIYKLMINRKASDHVMFQSVLSLFSAALILGLYVYMESSNTEVQAQNTSIELLDDVEWRKLGTEGFTNPMEPYGSYSSLVSVDPSVSFIRNGGTVCFRGVPSQGYQSARRILLDYAGLLKDSGKWSVRNYYHVLHIMSDVLMGVD